MESFEELLRRFQVPLLQFLRHVGPAADAEDVLQETFLRAYTRLHFYRADWRFATWLYTIARRASINYHRRPHPPADDEAIRAAASTDNGPAEAVAAADGRWYLWNTARRALGEDELAALWLHYVDEMPVGEIAAGAGPLPRGSEDDDVSRSQKAPTAGGRVGAGERVNGKDETMNDYEEIENDDRLALRLRREARRLRPAFSDAIHERLLEAIQAAPATDAIVPAPRGARSRALLGL